MSALFAPAVSAQGARVDYERAAGLSRRYRGKLRPFRPRYRWLPKAAGLWWREPGRAGGAGHYVRIDGATGERKTAKEAKAIGLDGRVGPRALRPLSRWRASGPSSERTKLVFDNRLDRVVRLFWVDRRGRLQPYGQVAAGAKREMSTYVGHVWVLDVTTDDLAGIFRAERGVGTAVVDARSRDLAKGRAANRRRRRRGASRGPGSRNLRFRNENVVQIRDGREVALSSDGTKEDPYRGRFYHSPDGRKVLCFQERQVETRTIPLVESSPKDRVQPKLSTLRYRKPGDAVPQRRPRLFDLEASKQLAVDDAMFADSYSVGRVHWPADSRFVYCLYNRRGHQQLALRAIDAATGAVKTIVDERSPTFVDYSQKTFLHWLEGDRELLWMSERDGHNHLYRIDARSGKLIAQVTRGSWVVRRVVEVDERNGVVLFVAMGIHAGQDPYHQHLVRVGLDGSKLTPLTRSDGNHAGFDFNEDRSLFVTRWSRVDQPTVTELRRVRDGKLVCELGRDDDRALREAGFSPPQRFVAKGRDGKTDIHGHLIRPSNFVAGRSYPVIEDIYAGPHGHHVPKRHGLGLRQRRLAELGFIVVQIDGMGTNWRSKAFHDVCWRNLKDAGFPDRIAWLRAAAAEHPELDLTRVGIFGGSAGGQNALAALLHHADFYRAAVADCGCHDNRMDKIWWNEAWMGVMGPHYADNSNVTHAGKLRGKLLLTVGELDRNVDPASTLQVVDALIRANKDFDFILVPGAGHGVGERPYLVRRRQDFFVRALLGVEPRR